VSNKVGYARVSTKEQNLDSQVDALKKAGCVRVFQEKLTGKYLDRPEWEKLIDYLQPGNVLVVTELSRMTRSLRDLLTIVELLNEKGVQLISLRENIDTTTATGRCFLHVMGAVHQMELELKAERASSGRESAKARGKMGGRPRTDQNKLASAKLIYENTEKTAQQVCEEFGISRRVFFNFLKAQAS
jgi:DNA invertase Pin-like site-specific DNA recombinase